MTHSRRSFIRVVGTSAIIVAATAAIGTGAFVATRDPRKARAPWKLAGRAYQDPMRRALSYAILAPNPHNRQPWAVDLLGEHDAILYCDLDRRLPETDPYDRQVVIGLGCFLELFKLAAAEEGYAAELVLFPDGEPHPRLDARPIARLTLVASDALQRDPLFQSVLDRRSNKQPYDTGRPVDPPTMERVVSDVSGSVRVGRSVDAGLIDAIRDVTWRALQVEFETPRTYMESIRLMRIGKAEIEQNPDGIDLGGPLYDALNITGVLTREKMADPNFAAQRALDRFRPVIFSAMGYVWLCTAQNRRVDQLEAGQSYVRINLRATGRGIGMHPVSQALQEYPEMDALRAQIGRVLSVPEGSTLQMLARVGYGPSVKARPRWPLEARIIVG